MSSDVSGSLGDVHSLTHPIISISSIPSYDECIFDITSVRSLPHHLHPLLVRARCFPSNGISLRMNPCVDLFQEIVVTSLLLLFVVIAAVKSACIDMKKIFRASTFNRLRQKSQVRQLFLYWGDLIFRVFIKGPLHIHFHVYAVIK